MTNTEHTHRVKYLTPNTIGLAKSRGKNEPYINVIMGRTVVTNVDECAKAGCK